MRSCSLPRSARPTAVRECATIKFCGFLFRLFGVRHWRGPCARNSTYEVNPLYTHDPATSICICLCMRFSNRHKHSTGYIRRHDADRTRGKQFGYIFFRFLFLMVKCVDDAVFAFLCVCLLRVAADEFWDSFLFLFLFFPFLDFNLTVTRSNRARAYPGMWDDSQHWNRFSIGNHQYEYDDECDKFESNSMQMGRWIAQSRYAVGCLRLGSNAHRRNQSIIIMNAICHCRSIFEFE